MLLKLFVRLAGVIAMLCLLTPRVAQAAPLTILFDVTVNRLCDSTTCHDVTQDGYTLTLVFDPDDVVYSFGVDIDLYSANVTAFGPPLMHVSGGAIADIPNPFGTVDIDSSSSSLGYNEWRQPVGYGHTSLGASVSQTHEGTVTNPDGSYRNESWYHLVRLARSVDYVGDGNTSPVTAADFLNELSIGSFDFDWSTFVFTRECPVTGNCVQLAQWVADPRNFSAFGTATLRAAAEPVPEPASVVLLATGLLAAASIRAAKRAHLNKSSNA